MDGDPLTDFICIKSGRSYQAEAVRRSNNLCRAGISRLAELSVMRTHAPSLIAVKLQLLRILNFLMQATSGAVPSKSEHFKTVFIFCVPEFIGENLQECNSSAPRRNAFGP